MLPPDSPSDFGRVLGAEVRVAWRTPAFWTIVLRHVIPVVGVVFFAWPAFQIAVFFVFESWLMLSLYAATDLTFNPKYGGAKTRDARAIVGPLLKQFLAAGLLIAFIVGMFGGFLLVDVFPQEDWSGFLDGGWREHSFLIGLFALAASCIVDAVHFAQRIAHRTAEEVVADDARIAGTFYRVVLLFMVSGLIGATAQWGFVAPLFVIALALVLTLFEGLPRSAALLLGLKWIVVRKFW